MIGTIVNTGAIILGSSLGGTLKKSALTKHTATMTKAIGLVATALGISMISKNMRASSEPVLFIISMILGCLIGSLLKITERVDKLGEKGAESGSNLVEGLTTAVLLFCIGALSIMGPIESALKGDPTLLFTNALLDLITSFILATTFGIGIILAAPILFIWQTSIYMMALLSGAFITEAMMVEVSIVGGILIFGTGLNVLEITKIKTLDFLPGLFIPIAYLLFR